MLDSPKVLLAAPLVALATTAAAEPPDSKDWTYITQPV